MYSQSKDGSQSLSVLPSPEVATWFLKSLGTSGPGSGLKEGAGERLSESLNSVSTTGQLCDLGHIF